MRTKESLSYFFYELKTALMEKKHIYITQISYINILSTKI